MPASLDFAPYRDASLPIEERVEDLIGRMTLAEKAGQLFHEIILIGPDGTLSQANPLFNLAGTEELVGKRLLTHFNLLGPISDVCLTVQWFNRLQERALQTRLGIPITLSTDPRHHFTDHVRTSALAGVFSQWPEPPGFAALRSPESVELFADIARQEYRAVGFCCALHPQIDLATEPRWARINGTFGEDADLSAELVTAYIRGFQGAQVGPQSVSTITKHFPRCGPVKNGEEPHFAYGREQVYPGNNLEYHLRPFKAAIAAGGTQMMPSYGMPMGTKYDQVGFAFNKGVLTGLLREEMGFTGIIVSDWGIISDSSILGQPMPARAWGLEDASEIERLRRALEAGCDQIGGESKPNLIIKLVQDGHLHESRIDESVRKLMCEKFKLGLFDHPFVDVDTAVELVGNAAFRKEGSGAQRRPYTLLTNKNDILPLSNFGGNVYVEGMKPELVMDRGLRVVNSPVDADFALVRLKAPYEPRPGNFEALFHAGSLEYSKEEKSRQASVYESLSTIVDLYADRPAIIPEIAEKAAALLISYGSGDEAFLDICFGIAKPEGKLPFDLPSSTAAVIASRTDMQYDTKDPLFRFSHGLEYTR